MQNPDNVRAHIYQLQRPIGIKFYGRFPIHTPFRLRKGREAFKPSATDDESRVNDSGGWGVGRKPLPHKKEAETLAGFNLRRVSVQAAAVAGSLAGASSNLVPRIKSAAVAPALRPAQSISCRSATAQASFANTRRNFQVCFRQCQPARTKTPRPFRQPTPRGNTDWSQSPPIPSPSGGSTAMRGRCCG